MPRWLQLLLQSVLTVCVLVALVLTVDPSALYQTLREARWPWVAAALLLLPLNLGLDGWVWARLLDAVDGTFPPRRVGTAVLSGLALGFWTPARLGEYAGRALSFPSADRWTVSLSVFAQRIVDMAVGVGIGGLVLLGTLLTGRLPVSAAWLIALGLGAGTTVVLTVVMLFPEQIHRWLDARSGWAARLSSRTAFFCRLTPQHKLDVGGGTVLRYVVFTGQFVCLSLALAPSAPVLSISLAAGLTFYAKYLIPSLTMLDLGVREGGAVAFFSLLGLPAAAGLSASLLLFSLNVLLPALVGLLFVPTLAAPGWASAGPEASASPADS